MPQPVIAPRWPTRRRKRAVTHRDPGRPSLTTMIDEVRQGATWAFAEAWGRTPQRKSRRAKSRWWRAVSQRVPRDAYRRIAKIDAFGVTQHPGRRDAV